MRFNGRVPGSSTSVLAAPAVPHGRTARRLAWLHLPATLRAEVEDRLGSPVASSQSQGTGSPPASPRACTPPTGRRLFVKAASKVAQRAVADSYAEEARVLARLAPYAVPAPELRWTHEDDEWVVLGLEDVGALTPERPWRDDELDRTLGLLTLVAQATTAVRRRPRRRAAAGRSRRSPAWPVPGRSSRPAPPTTATSARRPRWRPGCPTCRRRGSCTATPVTTTSCSAPTAAPCCATGTGRAAGRSGSTWSTSWSRRTATGVDVEPLLADHPLTGEVPAEEIDVWLAAYAGWMRRAGEQPLRASSPFLGVHARWSAEAAWSWLAARRGW